MICNTDMENIINLDILDAVDTAGAIQILGKRKEIPYTAAHLISLFESERLRAFINPRVPPVLYGTRQDGSDAFYPLGLQEIMCTNRAELRELNGNVVLRVKMEYGDSPFWATTFRGMDVGESLAVWHSWVPVSAETTQEVLSWLPDAEVPADDYNGTWLEIPVLFLVQELNELAKTRSNKTSAPDSSQAKAQRPPNAERRRSYAKIIAAVLDKKMGLSEKGSEPCLQAVYELLAGSEINHEPSEISSVLIEVVSLVREELGKNIQAPMQPAISNPKTTSYLAVIAVLAKHYYHYVPKKRSSAASNLKKAIDDFFVSNEGNGIDIGTVRSCLKEAAALHPKAF